MTGEKEDAALGCPECGGTSITEVTRYVITRSQRVGYFSEDGSVFSYDGEEVWDDPPYEDLEHYLEVCEPEALSGASGLRSTIYVCDGCGARFDAPTPREMSRPPTRVESLCDLWGLSDDEVAQALGLQVEDLPIDIVSRLPTDASRALATLERASRMLAKHVDRDRIAEVVRQPARAAGGGRSLVDLALEGEMNRLTMVIVDMFDLQRFQQ